MPQDVNCPECGAVVYRIQKEPAANGETITMVSREEDDRTPEGMPIYRCKCGHELRPRVKVPGG